MIKIRLVAALLCIACFAFGREKEGRLLVCVDAKAPFLPGDFAKASGAKLVVIEKRNPYKSFAHIFIEEDFVVLSEPLDPKRVKALSGRCGYRWVIFRDGSLEHAVSASHNYRKQIPKYSSEIPSLPVEDVVRIYALMEKVDQIFTKHGIRYWGDGGTLLGAVRNGGLIPWDDDLDICILEQDEKTLLSLNRDLAEANLGLNIHWKEFYQIYDKGGKKLKEGSDVCYPWIDIFPMILKRGEKSRDLYVHKSPHFFLHYSKDVFTLEQIRQIHRVPFGPIKIAIPGNPEMNLNSLYGHSQKPDLWKWYALEPGYNHKAMSDCLVGTALVEIDDYSPAPLK